MKGLISASALLILASAPALARPQAVASDPETSEEALAGAAAEDFLRSARVIDREAIPIGVTRPRRLTLTDGRRTGRAVWKTVDIYTPVKRFKNGGFELGFRDSYKHEIAAYELDKMLGLDMVPPTVERRLDRERGSLQLWVENAMTEAERRKREIRAPDTDRWNQQMYTVRLIRQLLDDSDFNNINNVLLDADFRIWIIDSSRGFRLGKELRAEEDLQRFSRSVLSALRDLDPELVGKRLKRWLTPKQVEALFVRRDLLVERADRLTAEKGEAAVLYP